MSDRYTDFKALRPIGEATHVPDDRLEKCGDDEPRRQRVATSRAGYPAEPADTTTQCRSCGTSIPDAQTKCRYCLTNHLDSSSAGRDDGSRTLTLLHVVHMVVESSSCYGAVAKGRAAATRVAANDTDQAVDACTLVDEFDDEPATQLADRWPVLPGAVRVASADGAQLLAAARDRTAWRSQAGSDPNRETATYLYDEGGRGISDEQALETLLAAVGDDGWLVPAIALQTVTDASETTDQTARNPARPQLECRHCGRATVHQFTDRESILDERWTGQPIWECQVCDTARYGPDPTDNSGPSSR